MQILKETGIDRRERKLISELYMEQWVKLSLDKEVWRLEGASEKVVFGEGFYSICTTNTLAGKFQRGWRLQKRTASNSYCEICTLPCAAGVIDRLIETGRWYGKKMNVDKAEVLKISNETIASTDYDSSNRTGERAVFQLFGKRNNKWCNKYTGN